MKSRRATIEILAPFKLYGKRRWHAYSPKVKDHPRSLAELLRGDLPVIVLFRPYGQSARQRSNALPTT